MKRKILYTHTHTLIHIWTNKYLIHEEKNILHIHIHTHTHTHTLQLKYVCVCVRVHSNRRLVRLEQCQQTLVHMWLSSYKIINWRR